MPPVKDIALIIPHYGDDADLKRCRASLKDCEGMDRVKVVVIDNNKKNVGYTAAVNRGISENPYMAFYWLLNNDTVVQKKTLTELLKAMKKYPQAGIVGSQLLDLNNEDIIVWGGSKAVIPGVHKSGSVSLGQLQEPTYERWATFGSVLLRAELVREVGLLDERFFLICSDSDYCFTARSRGWKVLHWPASKVFHDEKEGVSRAANTKRSDKTTAILMDDQRKFADKWINGRLFMELEQEVDTPA